MYPGLFWGTLLLLAPVLALPPQKQLQRRAQSIKWGPCSFQQVGKLPIECGSLAVPLDYMAPNSTETLTLSLLRSKAPKPPAKSNGSILVNFGGPGFEAVRTLDVVADLLHNMTGGHQDLIAFDPRGVGKTLTFSCFDTPAARELANAKFPVLPIDASDVALVDTWANTKVFSNICADKYKSNKAPEMIGTGFVARDMMQIVDALGEDGLLRFWGISYGSLLGQTVAAMFPDRMDRLVLDGVVNANNYYQHYGIDIDQLLSADSAFRAVLSACITAGPSKCALAANQTSTAALEATLLSLADSYKTTPVAAGTTVINAWFVRELYFVVIKYTGDVATATSHIYNLLHRRNLTAVADYYKSLLAGLTPTEDDAVWGIKCSDTIPRSTELKGIMPDVDHMIGTSKIFGKYLASVAAPCAHWPWKARGAYPGDFTKGVKTKNPILFIGNTYDPATPFESARRMAKLFGGVALEQEGFGHSTLSQPSACTWNAIAAYFGNGTVPETGKKCKVDTSLFP